MACIHSCHLSPKLRNSIASLRNSRAILTCSFTTPFAFSFSFSLSFSSLSLHPRSRATLRPLSVLSANNSFTWDDVLLISQPESVRDNPSDLKGYFEKIKLCNRGLDSQFEFLPFVIEDQIVGYVHNGFADHLRRFQNVFVFPEDNCNGAQVTLHSSLKTPEERTKAVGEVIKSLGELIPGIRNELYPVTSSFGAPTFFSLERAAAPYFGIKVYGVHMNGYVERDGQEYLWIGKRSQLKQTFPGMLDHLVAGGLPDGIASSDNVVKECEEEAGIPKSISSRAKPVGAVSYMDIDGCRYKRDVLFCYDLKLPESFIPKNEDGEVESFRLIPVKNVANVVRRSYFFKSNCSIVIIDFLLRHGYISPECFGYLDLLQSLRSGDCS